MLEKMNKNIKIIIVLAVMLIFVLLQYFFLKNLPLFGDAIINSVLKWSIIYAVIGIFIGFLLTRFLQKKNFEKKKMFNIRLIIYIIYYIIGGGLLGVGGCFIGQFLAEKE